MIDYDKTLLVDDDKTIQVSAGTATMSGAVLSHGQTIILNGKNCTIESQFSKSSGEAVVYKVKIDHKPFVLKHYKSNTPMSNNAKKIISKIKNNPHDRIVKVIDFGKYNDQDYEILEFAEGGTLDEYLRENPIRDEKRLKSIVKMISEGLRQLHDEYNVIYQDLKPDNIFFKDAKKTKIILADFGISSIMETGKKRAEVSINQTKLYGAPELALKPGENFVIATPAADYYSLGVTMFEMWLGEKPFKNIPAIELSNRIDEGDIDFPADMPEDYKTLIQGLIKGRGDRWGDNQIQQWLQGQPLQASGKTAQVYEREMFNENESYSNPKELAALMEKYPEQGEKILYSGIAAAWFEKAGRKLRAEEIKEIASTYANDKQSGYYSAIYNIDPSRPWVSKGRKTCTNLEEIAQALMAESAYYIEDLKKPNSRLYLYLTAVEGAKGASASNMFLKFFTESGYNPERALAMVCVELQDKCVTIGSKKYESPEELTQEKDKTQRDLIKKAAMETDSLLQVWLMGIYKVNFDIKQSPEGMFTLLGLLPYLSFKELAGSYWEQYALFSLRTFIGGYPGRSDFFETYAAQGLPLNKTLGANSHHKTPLDFIASNFKDISDKHGEDTVLSLICLLAKLGADVNALSGDGKTTLLNALGANNSMLIKTLVELGADKESMNIAYKHIAKKQKITDVDRRIMRLLNPSAITKVLLVLRTIFKFFYKVIAKILNIIESIANRIEYEMPSYIISGILAAGIAFGGWTLLERVYELEMQWNILATIGIFLFSYLITIYIAFHKYYGYRPVKLLIMLGFAVAGVAGYFTIPKSVMVIEPLTATVSSDALIMRKTPINGGEMVKTLKRGDNLIVLSNATNGWTLVRSGNSIGHVISSLISVTKQRAIVKSKNLVLHSGPFTNSINLKVLNKGDNLAVTGPSVNGWTPVKFDNTAGYVSSYLITIKNLATIATVTTNGLILYTRPSTSSTTLKFLKKGEVLTVTGNNSNGWTPVKSGNVAGWVTSGSIALER
ncbi:MAG: protein kinase [Fibromonadales bacterium]|nr:protein kinase [Fibromonadales bacterium]